MMSSGSSSSGSGRNQIQYCNRPSPFTATQFEELENQALIFKYFVSGVPVPPHLLYTVRPPILQPTMGWGCFQIGFGNKKADPEPGRCRRTDGKKWRCSKEAYADSKYCEKHMHRGKNRSKNKSLNLDVATSAKLSSPLPTQDYTSSGGGFYQSNNNNSLYPFLSSSPHSSIAVTPTSAFSGENKDTHHLLLGSSSSRYWGGMKEETGERTEAAYETYEPPLTMSTQTEYTQLQQHYQYSTDPNNNNLKNPFHHFFGEWPVKNKNPDSSQDEASATPQLSISIPPHSF